MHRFFLKDSLKNGALILAEIETANCVGWCITWCKDKAVYAKATLLKKYVKLIVA
jgi:hypothetical protein